jgi:hypothetical protein
MAEPTPSPFKRLLKSRKFLLLLLDVIISTLLFGVGQIAPQAQETVEFAVLTYQPVFIMLIGAIAYEDGQAKRAGTHPSQE